MHLGNCSPNERGAVMNEKKDKEMIEHRKRWAMLASALITLLTLISFSASYSTYLESFRDWGKFAPVLAFGAACGVEAGFSLMVYGATYALICKELGIAVIGTLVLLGVMVMNFVTHSKTVRGLSFTDSEQIYVTFVGPAAIFGTIFILLLIIWNLFESKTRRQTRKIEMLTEQKAYDHVEEFINSPEMEEILKDLNSAIETKVRKQLGVGDTAGTSTSITRRPGFAPMGTTYGPMSSVQETEEKN
jgi:hypothetical protein